MTLEAKSAPDIDFFSILFFLRAARVKTRAHSTDGSKIGVGVQ